MAKELALTTGEKGYYFDWEGSRPEKVTGAPDGCVAPLSR